MKNIEKADNEVGKIINDGEYFIYNFDYSPNHKLMFPIEKEGYTMKDIISKLKDGETISFLINDGETWNGETGNKFKMSYDEKYDNSIYWKHETEGDCVRVDSNMGSLHKWMKNYDDDDLISKEDAMKSGYYWLKDGKHWTIGFYEIGSDNPWCVVGRDEIYEFDHFDKIGDYLGKEPHSTKNKNKKNKLYPVGYFDVDKIIKLLKYNNTPEVKSGKYHKKIKK